MTKFDIKTEATKGLHAGVGAADLAFETVKEYVAEAQKWFEGHQKDAQKLFEGYQKDAQKLFEGYQKDAQKAFTSAQKSVKDFEFEPKALRSQATTVFNARVEGLSKDAKARRTAIERRVTELQGDATETYEDLAKRGETIVKRLRKQTSSVADPGPVSKSTGATTTAKKAPAKKTAAKKAPASKTAAK